MLDQMAADKTTAASNENFHGKGGGGEKEKRIIRIGKLASPA